MKKNKNKVVSLTLAGAVAVTALLAGTYAWRSISQEATNEARNTLNPGARLHDDFNGMSTVSEDGKLKNVYVENFTDDANGANVFARIRLDEYLEIGVGAGKKDNATDKNVEVIKPANATITPDINDKNTWTTYKWDGAYDDSTSQGSVFRGYVDINLGNDKASGVATGTGAFGAQDEIYYMPTYNKNKDSLEAEINGTLAGPDGDQDTDIDAYKDYVAYTSISTEWGIEIYDADEEAQGVLPADEIVANGLTAEGIIESVMDTNGGFAATALDLTTSGSEKVTFTKEDGTTVQYDITKIEPSTATAATDITAIEVSILGGTNAGDAVANIRLQKVTTVHTAAETQATEKVITMDQWKAIQNDDDKTGNFWVVDLEDGWAYWAAPIEPGKATGRLISSISTIAAGGVENLANKEYYYGLNVVAQFATAGDWGTDAGDKDHSTGFYGEGITSDALTLLNTISGMTAMNGVQTAKASLKIATAGSTVQIDGVTYIVAVQNTTDSKALLVAQDVLKDDTSNAITKTYDEAETYLNGTFLGSKKVLNSLAIVEGTRAKVFMLSEDDVAAGGAGSDYTDGSAQLSNLGTITTAYWLRTLDGTDNAKIDTNGTVSSAAKTDANALRPAVWVNYATAAQ